MARLSDTEDMAADLAGVKVGAGHPVRIMAVLNVSPESFYSGSVSGDAAALREAAKRAAEDGADLIDVGAMSTAPYRETRISVADEVRRMTWALEIVGAVVPVPVSADTMRAPVAAAALAAGARIINDVSGFRADEAMADIAAQGEGVVLTASQGGVPLEGDPLGVVAGLLQDSLARADRAGISRRNVVLDPGIGFFTQQNLAPEVFSCRVLARLRELERLARPLVVGVSRKSFIGKLTGRIEPAERLWGSLAAAALAVAEGAAMIRTHDVGATRDAVRVAEAIRKAAVPGGDAN